MRLSGLASALVLLSACGSDLLLPPTPGPLAPPTLTDFSPARAHAGGRLALRGSGFAADPASNQVFFPGGSARGEAFAGDGALLVRVPDDAGSGAILVETSAGRSLAVGGFEYAGLGRPRYGRVWAEHPLSLEPRVLAVANGQVAMESGLFSSVLLARGAEPAQVLATRTSALAASDETGLFYVVTSSPGLVLQALTAAGEVAASAPLDEFPDRLLVTPPGGAGRVLTIREDLDLERTSVQAYDAETLQPLGATRVLSTLASFATADVLADGTVLGLATRVDDGASGIGVLAGDGAERFVVQEGLSTSHSAALAADAVLAFVDGEVPVLVDLSSGERSSPLEDYSGGLPSDVAVARGAAPLAVVARCGASEVSAWTADGRLAWTNRDLPCPARLTVNGSGTRVFVADGRLNEVRVLEAATGRALGGTRFPLAPGSPRDTGLVRLEGRLYVPTASGRLLTVDLSDFDVSDLHPGLLVNDVATDGRSLWGFGLANGTAVQFEPGGAASAFALQGPVLRSSALAEGGLLLALPEEVVRLKGATVDAQRRWEEVLGGRLVRALLPTPAGGALVVSRSFRGDFVDAFEPAALFTPDGAATPLLTPPGPLFTVYGAFAREGRFLLATDDELVASTRVFDEALQPVATAPSALRSAEFTWKAPGDQSLAWADAAGRLHFGRFTPAGGITEDATVLLGAPLRGLAWNSAGDRVFVLVAGRDAIVEID
jgi:hypothetical protein